MVRRWLQTRNTIQQRTHGLLRLLCQPRGAEWPAAATVSAKICVIGGQDGSGSPLATNEEYDPATNTWSTKTAMPTARRGHCALAVGNKIYVIGGFGSGGMLTTNEEYDPSSDTWTTKASMPSPRRWFGAASVNNRICVIGGSDGSIVTATNYEYDPATDTWSTKTSKPTADDSFPAATVNSRIYAFGGFEGHSIEEYRPFHGHMDHKGGCADRKIGTTAAAAVKQQDICHRGLGRFFIEHE